MTKFRPCIDLHAGHVKQIVGGTLTENSSDLKTNFVSAHSAGYYASLYREHNLTGGHVILLGPGNEAAAAEALAAWPGGLQVGGGVNEGNAAKWLESGAEKVIITSYLFPGGVFEEERLKGVLRALGGKRGSLVVDLSCRRRDGGGWVVATDKWRTRTDFEVNSANIKMLEKHCSEFLVHAADVEGKQEGIDLELVQKLGEWCSIPVTYAGGARSIEDLETVKSLSNGKVDLTIGSALDVFGGSLVKFEDCVRWNNAQTQSS